MTLSSDVEFNSFNKIPRLSRDIIITEKIDGTSGVIYIPEDGSVVLKSGLVVPFLCGSRNRWIFPENDNAGFARWAYENAEELLKLGPGRHFGEWWGQGIQRRYGLKENRFTLFNTNRWGKGSDRPSCCSVVPVLYSGPFDTTNIDLTLVALREYGSVVAPGFMDPEGIVIFHSASGHLYKKTLNNDGKPKSLC